MITKKIEESLRHEGSIAAEIVEELHLLIKERGVRKRKSTPSAWRHNATVPFVGHNREDAGSCGIDESILEEMYRHYISTEGTPALTFCQYLGAVESITGVNAI